MRSSRRLRSRECGSGRNGSCTGCIAFDLPVVGEKLSDALGRVEADPTEDVAQVGEGIDVMPLASCDNAAEDRCGAASVVAPEEEPVGPAYGDAPERCPSGERA